MKTYVKPSFKKVQLCAEEGIACVGSPAKVDVTYKPPKIGFSFGGFDDFFSKFFAPRKHKTRRR